MIVKIKSEKMILTFSLFKSALREKTYGLTPKKKQEKKKAQE
jgi:hypothetical protein